MKFIYAHPPAWILTIPWEQQAFARVAAEAMKVAEAQGIVMSSAWHEPTDAHHRYRQTTPLLGRVMPNYDDFCDAARLGIVL